MERKGTSRADMARDTIRANMRPSVGEPKHVSLADLGRMRQLLDRGHVNDGDLLVHPDGRTIRVHATEDGYGFETVGWGKNSPGEKPTLDPAAVVEERLGRLERHEREFVEGFTDAVRDHNDLAEHVQHERADRLNMARRLIELEDRVDHYKLHWLRAVVIDEAFRLTQLEAKVEELARRMHADQPGFDFPWPPIPRENEQAPTVHDLERDTEDRLAEQPVTEEAAERSQRLNDILLNVALAAERRYSIHLGTGDTRILNDYLGGLDPHCGVAEVPGG